MVASIIYWVVLILSIIGVFTPQGAPGGTSNWSYVSKLSGAILFILIGLRVFKLSLT